jgi:hypothetical protein
MSEPSADTHERVSSRSKLLFHATGIDDLVPQLLSEYGLAARRHTLTPCLEIAVDHLANNNLLTVWYPNKAEVVKMSMGATYPTNPIDEEVRQKMLAKVQDADTYFKDAYKRIIEQATTLLPSTKLGAILGMRGGLESRMLGTYPHRGSDEYFKRYISESSEWIKRLEKDLAHAEVYYIQSGLTTDDIARDIIKADFEHALIEVGEDIDYDSKKNDSEALSKRLDQLKEVEFDNPIHERYRQMLIGKIQRLLK